MGALRLKTKRQFTFKGKFGDSNFSLTMKFPSAEDIDYSDLEAYQTEDGNLTSDGQRKATIRTLRQAIKSWTGIEDEDGKPLEIDDDSTRAVFDIVLADEKLFGRILQSYNGLSQKN